MASVCRLFAAAALLALAGCGLLQPPERPMAIATFIPTSGNATTGQVRLVQVGDRLHVNAEIRGLKPFRDHALHVHEAGNCTSPDASSAGDHFDPGHQPHGRFDAAKHHAGDLPNVRADASGNALVDFETSALRLGGGETDIVGRALVLHRDRDDFRTQPDGKSGPALACAVIVRTNLRRP